MPNFPFAKFWKFSSFRHTLSRNTHKYAVWNAEVCLDKFVMVSFRNSNLTRWKSSQLDTITLLVFEEQVMPTVAGSSAYFLSSCVFFPLFGLIVWMPKTLMDLICFRFARLLLFLVFILMQFITTFHSKHLCSFRLYVKDACNLIKSATSDGLCVNCKTELWTYCIFFAFKLFQ